MYESAHNIWFGQKSKLKIFYRIRPRLLKKIQNYRTYPQKYENPTTNYTNEVKNPFPWIQVWTEIRIWSILTANAWFPGPFLCPILVISLCEFQYFRFGLGFRVRIYWSGRRRNFECDSFGCKLPILDLPFESLNNLKKLNDLGAVNESSEPN